MRILASDIIFFFSIIIEITYFDYYIIKIVLVMNTFKCNITIKEKKLYHNKNRISN